jgi:uncharacterized protein with ParB-like and HNH nuclease domain
MVAGVAVEIKGEQHTVGEIFGERFAFTVPPNQRQYAWKLEHAAALLDDLLASLGGDAVPIEQMDPYFLGSIVLVKASRQEYEIVDGQQRLITLTMLLATLREKFPEQYRESITSRLYEPADPLNNVPAHYRLRPKQHNAEFFRAFIQNDGGIQRLLAQPHADLSEGQQNMHANVRHYWDELTQLPQERSVCLAQCIMQRCLMVVISTPGLVSAYRIFTEDRPESPCL